MKTKIELTLFESSAVEWLEYDDRDETLIVQWSSGNEYIYENVPLHKIQPLFDLHSPPASYGRAMNEFKTWYHAREKTTAKRLFRQLQELSTNGKEELIRLLSNS